jgi:hypothetical protein
MLAMTNFVIFITFASSRQKVLAFPRKNERFFLTPYSRIPLSRIGARNCPV